MAAALLISTPVTAQSRVPFDTASIVSAALTAFDSKNGPYVEIEERSGCMGPLGQRVDGSVSTCTTNAVDSAIWKYATSKTLRIVRSADGPVCPWESAASQRPKGSRISVAGPWQRADDVAEVSISLHCVARRGFAERVTYEIKVVEGKWKVTRIVEHVIT